MEQETQTQKVLKWAQQLALKAKAAKNQKLEVDVGGTNLSILWDEHMFHLQVSGDGNANTWRLRTISSVVKTIAALFGIKEETREKIVTTVLFCPGIGAPVVFAICKDGKWVLPTGCVTLGDVDTVDTCRRILFEEAGLNFRSNYFIREEIDTSEGFDNTVAFVMVPPRCELGHRVAPGNLLAHAWFSIASAVESVNGFTQEMADAIKQNPKSRNGDTEN